MILPCYDEEKTIAQVIDEVFAVLPNAHIYVFDNNSSDNSRNIVKAKIDEIKSLDCHIERSEISNMESKKDFSCLHTRTSGALAHTCKNDKTAEFCNFAPLRPAPTHLDKNLESNPCHTEPLGEVSNVESKQDFSPFSKAQNDKIPDSLPTNHANKTTNSSSCSMALEALSELEGRSYLSDNDYPSQFAQSFKLYRQGRIFTESKTLKSPQSPSHSIVLAHKVKGRLCVRHLH